MIIRPELQALRSADTPQRQAQVSLHGLVTLWRTSGAGAGIETALGGYAGGAPLSQLPPSPDCSCREIAPRNVLPAIWLTGLRARWPPRRGARFRCRPSSTT